MNAKLREQELHALSEIVVDASRRAADALGAFSGQQLTVGGTTAHLPDVEDILWLHGNPEEAIVGIDFAIQGDLDGFLLAFFNISDASRLLETLVGISVHDVADLGELELSALGEAGNIIVASFLSSLESLCGLQVTPSPPAVAVEMCGAILTSAVLPVVEAGSAILAIEAEIAPQHANTQAAACRVLFLPTAASWCTLHQAFRGSALPRTGPGPCEICSLTGRPKYE